MDGKCLPRFIHFNQTMVLVKSTFDFEIVNIVKTNAYIYSIVNSVSHVYM